MTWPSWRADVEREVEFAMKTVDRVFADPSLLQMSRQALANDGHCRADAPDVQIAALSFEQFYVSRLTTLVQSKGNFWGGKDAELAHKCSWSRAAALLSAETARRLLHEGIVVLDGALTSAEAAAARAEIAQLDRGGQLKEVEAQSKARVRNDKIGWIGAGDQASADFPALHLAARLLRAIPHEVEKACGAGWRLACPKVVMAAVYDGSPQRPTYYTKHFDGGPPGGGSGNPRKLTVILYLNEEPWDVARDGGCLRAYLPRTGAGRGADSGAQYMDVVPVAGRMLLFDSQRIEHEVLPSYRRRAAVTLWANGLDLA